MINLIAILSSDKYAQGIERELKKEIYFVCRVWYTIKVARKILFILKTYNIYLIGDPERMEG